MNLAALIFTLSCFELILHLPSTDASSCDHLYSCNACRLNYGSGSFNQATPPPPTTAAPVTCPACNTTSAGNDTCDSGNCCCFENRTDNFAHINLNPLAEAVNTSMRNAGRDVTMYIIPAVVTAVLGPDNPIGQDDLGVNVTRTISKFRKCMLIALSELAQNLLKDFTNAFNNITGNVTSGVPDLSGV